MVSALDRTDRLLRTFVILFLILKFIVIVEVKGVHVVNSTNKSSSLI